MVTAGAFSRHIFTDKVKLKHKEFTVKKFSLIFYVVCAYAILLASCANNNGAGSVNFEISKADFEKLTKIYKDNNGDPNGDEEYRELEISIRGAWNQTKTIRLSDDQMEVVRPITCSFDGIPVGSTVYADINFIEYGPDAYDGRLVRYGYTEKFRVKSGNNTVPVKMINAPEDCEYEYKYPECSYLVSSSDASDIELDWNMQHCLGNDGYSYFLCSDKIKNSKSTVGDEYKEGCRPYALETSRITVDIENDNYYLCNFAINAENSSQEAFCIYECGYNFAKLYDVNYEQPDLLVSFPALKDLSIRAFAVNGDNFYVLTANRVSDNTEYSLYTIRRDWENDEAKWSYSNRILDFDKYVKPAYSEAEIFRDMIFYEGALYFILGRNGLSNEDGVQSFHSYGCLLKYNPSTGKMSSLGLTNEKLLQKDYKDTGLNVYINDVGSWYCTTYNGSNLVFNKSVSVGGVNYNPKSYLPNLYTPAPLSPNESTDYFYGPYKFIGLKPRKLVISDDGVAFYTNDDGALCAKNVNRKVYVNLADFSIEDFETTSTNLEGDYDLEGSTGWIKLNIESELEVDDRTEFFKKAFDLSESDKMFYQGGAQSISTSEFTSDTRIFFAVPVI